MPSIATAAVHQRSDVIGVTKKPGETIGLCLAVQNLQTSDGVVVTSIARSSPLVGLVRPGDRILSCNGLRMGAGQLAKAAAALSELTLVVAPPLAVRAKVAREPTSMFDAAKSITARQALATVNR